MCPTTGLIHVLKQIMQVWTYLTNDRHHLNSGVSKKGGTEIGLPFLATNKISNEVILTQYQSY